MKKKLLLFAGIAMSLISYGQANVNFSFTQMTDSLLYPLNKSQITTGILYDRVFPFAGLHSFNTLNGNPDTSSYPHYYQGYSEIYNAAYSKTNLMNDYRLDTIAKAVYFTNSVIPISVMYYNMNLIDTNAIASNLLYNGSDSLLHDVAGRTGNPYILKTITVAAALAADTILYGTGNFKFKYYSQLFFTNNGATITSITANFGTGNINITSGNTVTTNYSTGGTKTIQFTITYSNGQSVTTYSKIFISSNASQRFGSPVPPDETRNIVDIQYGFQGYDETAKKYNKSIYGIYYHRTSPGGPIETKIRKPIILVDGFDPADERIEDDIYGYYLSYTATDNFGSEMRDKGYDIIVLNFQTILERTVTITFSGVTVNFPVYRYQGADYMQRNAFLLVTLIEKINAELLVNGSTEKLVVVGPSMGGLITRYALKWMEVNPGHNHNTRLWISFDSPHKGANIAIGDQHFLDFFAKKAGNKGAEKARDSQINSVAAKQLLLHHYLGNYGTLNSLPVGAPNFRDRWQLEIDNLGYPSNLRKIALINGAINGTVQGQACERVLDMRTLLRANYFLFKIGRLRVGKAEVSFTGNYGSYCEVFNGWAKIWFNTNGRSAAAPSSSKSYDIVPGGYYSTQQEIVESGQGYDPIIGGYSFGVGTTTRFNVLKATHSFIPTYSALGLSLTNKDLASNLYNRNLVCTGETIFDSYYAPSINEEHVTLTTANVAWIKKEIDGIPQAPSYNYASLYSIQLTSGSEPLCTSANVYSFSNLPSGGSVIWSTLPLGIANVASSGNGAQATVTRITNGNFSLIASLTYCGKPAMAIISKDIHAGGFSSIDYPVSGPSSACKNTNVTYSTNSLPGATGYNWFYPASWTYYGGQNTRSITLKTGNTTGYFQVGVRVANACDAGGSYAFASTNVNSCGGFAFEVSPNPTKGNVTVNTVTDASAKTDGNKIYKIRVTDQSGSVKKVFDFPGTSTTVNITLSQLTKGIFQLSVYNGEEWSSAQVILQ